MDSLLKEHLKRQPKSVFGIQPGTSDAVESVVREFAKQDRPSRRGTADEVDDAMVRDVLVLLTVGVLLGLAYAGSLIARAWRPVPHAKFFSDSKRQERGDGQ